MGQIGYRLTLGNGDTVTGRTDKQGKTQRVATDLPVPIVKAELTAAERMCCARGASGDEDVVEVELEDHKTRDVDVGASVKPVQAPETTSRGLTLGEMGMARPVLGDSIDYAKVKVHKGGYWLFFGQQDETTAVTPNGEMYWPKDVYEDDFVLMDADIQAWFMHEMAHVWQYQLGYPVKTMGAALHVDEKLGLVEDVYDYTLDAGKRLRDYNMEQQGDILADYYLLSVRGSAAQRFLKAKKYRETPHMLAALERVLADFLRDPADPSNLPRG